MLRFSSLEVQARLEAALDACGAQGVGWGECGLDFNKRQPCLCSCECRGQGAGYTPNTIVCHVCNVLSLYWLHLPGLMSWRRHQSNGHLEIPYI